MINSAQHKLFLITGPSGAGKTTHVQWLLSKISNVVCLQKAVTRSARPAEQPDREVVFFEESAFLKRVQKGTIVAAYRKYETWYGLFASSWKKRFEPGMSETVISGVDALESSDGITLGDPYEAPAAIKQVCSNVVVVLLYASFRTIVQRIIEKNIPYEQRENRLRTVDGEFKEGFPTNVAICDYSLSTEEPLDVISEQLISIIHKERGG